VSKLHKILKKYNYLFEVHELDMGCALICPERCLDFYLEPEIRAYNISKDEQKPGVLISSTLLDDTWVDIPRYAISSVISLDIAKTCQEYEYDLSLIRYINLGGHYCKTIDLSGKLELSDKEKELKVVLDTKFVEQAKKQFKDDVSEEVKLLGIDVGYEILVNLFRSDEDESVSSIGR